MHHLRKQVSYIKGLTEGMDLGAGSKEGRIIKNIVDVLDDFTEYVQTLHERQAELESYLETVDEDLYDLEEDVYEEIPDDIDEDFDYVEVECPDCNEIVCFESDILDDQDIIEVTCPNCEDVVFVNDGSFEINDEYQEMPQDDRRYYNPPSARNNRNTQDI